MDTTGSGTEGNTVAIFTRKLIEALLVGWFEVYGLSDEYFEVCVIDALEKVDEVLVEVEEIRDVPFTTVNPEYVAKRFAEDPMTYSLMAEIYGDEIGTDELVHMAVVVAACSLRPTLDAIERGMNDMPPEEGIWFFFFEG